MFFRRLLAVWLSHSKVSFHRPTCVREDSPVAKAPHLYLLYHKHWSPAHIVKAYFLLDGGVDERSTVEHLVVSHQRDESVRTYSELTTRQCGRRRAKTRGIVRFIVAQPVGALAGVKEKLSQDFVFETSDKRTLVWFGSSFGADISLQNPEPHPYSQPRSYGIVCSKNDRLNIFILYPFSPPSPLPIFTDSLWWTPLPWGRLLWSQT